LELTGPAPEIIIDALVDAGVPVAQRNRQTRREIGYGATNTESNVWTLKHDGSVNGYGLELVSPKLSGDAGFDMLEKVCTALNGVDATVDRTCGLHVHHDMRGLGVDAIIRQVQPFVARQETVMRLVAPSRRGNTYSPLWTQWHMDELARCTRLESVGNIGPRGVLNMWAYGQHGSVEVRAHAGTTNFRKIAAWVRFGQAMFAAGDANVELTSESDAPAELLAQLEPFGLTSADASWLLRFEHAGATRESVRELVEALRQQMMEAESVLEEVN
jgi:hypothetical protein